jgi:mRNA interferase YafQ
MTIPTMKYNVKYSSRIKKQIKQLNKRNYDLSLFHEVVDTLARGEVLDQKHRDHALKGKWNGYRDCHIKPDWMLIYRIEDDSLILLLIETGTHSDLFNE